MKLIVNESPADRVVRVVLGVVIVAVAGIGGATAPLLYVAWALAALLLITGVVGFCPAYALLGIGTAHARR